MNLKADSLRRLPNNGEGGTGIYVRALRGEEWASVDIAELDKESLLVWLASRDDNGDHGRGWRDSVILALLGHPR